MGMNQVSGGGGSDLVGEEKQCPGCGHMIQTKLQQQQQEWLGLPAGVKFDPTDQELLDHLQAKVESQHCKSHPLIDEFIPTIEGDGGICYTHPEKLPGVKRNGLSRHYFHRPSKAYTTGTRKRRKIQTECDIQGGETRWHKTGKTRAVMVSGKQKGCKKILVLYTNFGKNRKPEKTNWVMHQYHLGMFEEEREGELVVSKIFYQTQPRQCTWSERSAAVVVHEVNTTTTTAQKSEELCCGGDGDGDGDAGGGDGASHIPFPSSYIQPLESDHLLKTSLPQGEESCAVVANGGEHNIQEDHHHVCRHEHVSTVTPFVSSAPHTPSASASTILHHDSYDLSTFILPNQRFEVSQMENTHDLEWLKYSFWEGSNGSEHHR